MLLQNRAIAVKISADGIKTEARAGRIKQSWEAQRQPEDRQSGTQPTYNCLVSMLPWKNQTSVLLAGASNSFKLRKIFRLLNLPDSGLDGGYSGIACRKILFVQYSRVFTVKSRVKLRVHRIENAW